MSGTESWEELFAAIAGIADQWGDAAKKINEAASAAAEVFSATFGQWYSENQWLIDLARYEFRREEKTRRMDHRRMLNQKYNRRPVGRGLKVRSRDG